MDGRWGLVLPSSDMLWCSDGSCTGLEDAKAYSTEAAAELRMLVTPWAENSCLSSGLLFLLADCLLF